MDLENAMKKHVEWKMKFRSAISKKEQMDAVSLAKDDCCEIGIWLHGAAKKQFSHLPSHAACIQKHLAFHVETGKIALAINGRKYVEAEAMLNAGSAYTAASSALGVAIMQLKKASGL